MTNPADKPCRALKWLVFTLGGLMILFVVLLVGDVAYDLLRPLSVTLPVTLPGKLPVAEKRDAAIQPQPAGRTDEATTRSAERTAGDDRGATSTLSYPVPPGAKPDQLALARLIEAEYRRLIKVLADYEREQDRLSYEEARRVLDGVYQRWMELDRKRRETFPPPVRLKELDDPDVNARRAIDANTGIQLGKLRNTWRFNDFQMLTRHDHWLEAAVFCDANELGDDRVVACARRAGPAGVAYLAKRRLDYLGHVAAWFAHRNPRGPWPEK